MQTFKMIAGALLFCACSSGVNPACIEVAVRPGSGPKILFIRGADGSGGFIGASSFDEKTEHLADIRNACTNANNHGWHELAEKLVDAGFSPEQRIEPLLIDDALLKPYAVVVFGSNNASYSAGEADAVFAFVQKGGGALFISDANFGSDWADAPSSDQTFLDRFGLTMNQDQGTYAVDHSDFVILTGVASFDGEGVSPCTVSKTIAGVSAQVVARAKGERKINDNPAGGTLVPVTPADGALVVATLGSGRVACHFDRNTFFNIGGTGTHLHNLDNARYAQNLFAWLAGRL